MNLMYRCCECGDRFEGRPAIRLPFDEAIRRLTRDEATEGTLMDTLGALGITMGTGEVGELYEVCRICAEDDWLGNGNLYKALGLDGDLG